MGKNREIIQKHQNRNSLCFFLIFARFCVILFITINKRLKYHNGEVYFMDVANVSSALSAVRVSEPATVSSAVGLKMLSKALDMNETVSQGLTKMMEMSVNPHIGGNIDVSV